MSLSKEDFTSLCKLSHLVAIDLLIYYDNKLLLGLRKNVPAKDTYFVPGGRVHKMENLNNAIQRISNFELGISLDINKIKKLGIYEHIYDNSFVDINNPTHYIVFPISYQLNEEEFNLITNNKIFFIQHNKFLWQDISSLEENENIHFYTKYYFDVNPPNKFM
jgi:colanic acid biosynthesis protein WcaH